jgi:hypothetical protein
MQELKEENASLLKQNQSLKARKPVDPAIQAELSMDLVQTFADDWLHFIHSNSVNPFVLLSVCYLLH